MTPKPLTRDRFRESVFARDGHQCVVRAPSESRCPARADDAHHIIERRLWGESGGYFVENGASVCEPHHLMCEQTLISCEDLREWCGIGTILVPDHLYSDTAMDKWGNPLLPNGNRMRGELFHDESVQKVLAPVMHLFTNRVKYPRTYHLPWSPGLTKDDRSLGDVSCFEGREVVVTVKQDGENCTWYRDGLHARSLEYDPHPSRDWVKARHARVAYEIPDGWRICGENLYAKHSIHYQHLSSYFQVFSIWDGLTCLGWDDTVAYANVLDLKTVPVLWRGTWNTKTVEQLAMDGTHAGDVMEGYVVRLAESFQYGAFRRSCAKYVRAGHVMTSHHWKRGQVVPNEVERT